MPEEQAVQYVAKLKANLVADRKTRMAATKPMVAKVVKFQQVGHVKLPPQTAEFISPQVLHKDVKDVEDKSSQNLG